MADGRKPTWWAKFVSCLRRGRTQTHPQRSDRSVGESRPEPRPGSLEETVGNRDWAKNQVLIINSIRQCHDGNRNERRLSFIDGILIHRISSELGRNAKEITASFNDTSTKYSAGSYTGGKMPYTFVIREDGLVEQARPLTLVTPHAKGYNQAYVSIACIGDYRKHKPSKQQWLAAAFLVESLRQKLRKPLAVFGHTEKKNASADPDKQCPGKYWNMDKFRVAVRYLEYDYITVNLETLHA